MPSGSSFAADLEVRLDLRPDLARDLLRRALLRRLAVEDPGRVPVGDVDREAVDGGAVAVVARGSRGPPRTGAWVSAVSAHGRIDEGDVAVGDVDRLPQVVLDADHPVDEELVHALERGIGGEHVRRPELAGALDRHRADEPVGLDLAAPAAAGRARAPRDPAAAASGAPRRAGRARSARRACFRWLTHGLIQASFVGAFSTRSRAPSLPRPHDVMTNASPMFPIVRVLATVSFAATRLRVRPRGDDRLVLVGEALGADEVPPG